MDTSSKYDTCVYAHVHTRSRAYYVLSPPARLEMAMGTRNPSTRWVLPDKDAGMERILYPCVRYWVKFSTHRVWRVRVWNSSTHTRIPVGKKYP
jgi:hypothetical protein